MASFSEANFVKKLQDLNASQQSIQTLSLWLIRHRKHSNSVVNIWLAELKKGMSDNHNGVMYEGGYVFVVLPIVVNQAQCLVITNINFIPDCKTTQV